MGSWTLRVCLTADAAPRHSGKGGSQEREGLGAYLVPNWILKVKISLVLCVHRNISYLKFKADLNPLFVSETASPCSPESWQSRLAQI